MTEEKPGPDSGREERRVNVEIRQLFIDAYEVVEPFFDPANQWGGRDHEHLAYRALHERFPNMAPDQLFIIITAAKRVFSSGGKPV
ncbi:MAG TPA: hypothetical protein VMB75_11495 [Rhodocyclaceae bacterium]|nr:hypothetical protein [Rhodocyclaceae bacterium]